MITGQQDYYISLIERLRRLPAETEWLEYKSNNIDPQMIGEYISAISNSAALERREKGYLLWGIDDTTHKISGTDFCPGTAKKGNQELENWLVGLSNPRLNIQFIEVDVKDKKAVILEISMASVKPTAFAGEEYIRIGSYKKKLKDFPEKERALWQSFETTPYEMRTAIENVTEEEITQLLDCAAYYTLMKLPLPSNRSSMMYNMKDEEFIREMDNGQYAITNMGALLFAKDLNKFSHLKRKAVRVIQYKGTGRTNAIREQVFLQGYALCFDEICRYIDTLIPQEEEIHIGLRQIHRMFPEKAVREMVGNMIIHQELTMRGAGPMMEIFDARVEASNPGCLLVEMRRYIPYWA